MSVPPLRRLRAASTPIHGEVVVPGSKSIANRALVAAALAAGDSELANIPDGDDTVAMLDCLHGLGVHTAVDPAGDGTVVVAGTGGRLHPVEHRLQARLAGTTSRFVTALAALADVPVVIDGDPPLRQRPMAELHDALATLGAGVGYGERAGHLPVVVTGPLRRGGTLSMRGDVSSQFVTALMLIAPRLQGGLRIELTTPLVSLPYVRLTAAVIGDFGVEGVEVEECRIAVPAGTYRGRRFDIEPDVSSASYPLAIAAGRGGEITVTGLTPASLQGDIALLDILAEMGCDVASDANGVTVSRDENSLLHGVDVDMSAVSDLVPTVAALAVTASTPTTIRGVGFIRAKESDRLGDLSAELVKTGALIAVTGDGLRIEPVPGGPRGLHGAELGTHHDHRLAMAFGVLGSIVDGVVVDGAEAVTKSWPGFWDTYDALLSMAD